MTTLNWDEIELLPRVDCCVCAVHAVPWGRTLDNRYFCSKGCCGAFEAGRTAVSRARGDVGFCLPEAANHPGVSLRPVTAQDTEYLSAA